MADDEQFSLCWNNFNTNLSAGFHESLLRGDLVDVTLAAEGQLVKAHRLILSVCSPYFRKMLTQVPATQHAFIFLKDVSHSALKDLIQFMYCGEVNVKQDALPAFISTAEALQIKGLTETGDSAPAQQSPAKEVIAAPPATISVPIATATGGSPRTKVQRTRVHSYKLESEESGDDKVQIQAGSSHHVTAQQVQQQTQHTTTQKRTLQQRTVIPIQPSKRTKLSVASVEALEAPEATPQVQTVQIVKQVLEPDYVEIPIESINAKAEPEYADETGEIETVETEAEQEHTLTEHEQSVEQEQADDDGNYVEDEYAEMGKFEESYFTEGEDAKAGASGFGDSYTSDGGTGTEQSAQDKSDPPKKADNKQIESKLPKTLQPDASANRLHRPVKPAADNPDGHHRFQAKIVPLSKEKLMPIIAVRSSGPANVDSATSAFQRTRKNCAKSRQALDFDEITKRPPTVMTLVPTLKGSAGVEYRGHHFEFHYTRKHHKVYRCAWHISQNCTAQVVLHNKLFYVVRDEHTHGTPAKLHPDILGKNTLKINL
ncbi:modifier of mdg4-like isoform X4 [Anopheles coustani]|uniref:modifier of mdg4-like isoform X4 n=1 Tax=Anopheles coustani TaxID=139045 RepID=UPI0026598378|nr:modifier of mdg4-like isoform X4 [Anopheles coustani]